MTALTPSLKATARLRDGGAALATIAARG